MAGIVLNNPATQATFTNTGVISNYNADAVFGNALFPWTVNNRGKIQNTGTTGDGIHLLQGGTVNNLVPGTVPAYASQIIGYDNGVLIQGAPGLVTNLGFIAATGTNGQGVRLTDGGKVVNGSSAVTNALIEGQLHAISISGGAGTVVNFGELVNQEAHTTVLLFDGGSVINGASNSTAAYITGPGTGVYARYGAAIVTNFGSITGSTGVFLRDGGTVNNGAAGSTAATITGTSANAVSISGSAGAVSNFGTLATNSTHSVVGIVDGGRVINGSAAVTTALITGNGTGVYFANHAAGSVTNFGTIAAVSPARGSGITMRDGGSVFNVGTISNQGSTSPTIYILGAGSITNSVNSSGSTMHVGLISGTSATIVFRGGAGTVTNSGQVHSTSSSGIYMAGGGTVNNMALGAISGRWGVYGRGVPISVTNSGNISTVPFGVDGVLLGAGGSVLNQAHAVINGGSVGVHVGGGGGTVTNGISAVISGTIGIYNSGPSGNLTVTNSGTIASTAGTAGVAVDLGNSVGHDLLIVKAGAVFIGTVNGGGNGEVDFLAGGVANAGSMSGFATIGLGNGVAHSLTLTDSNFANVSFSHITVVGGNSGNTVNAFGVTQSTHTVIFVGGAGKDVFTGGAGNDIFRFSAAALQATDAVAGKGGSSDTLQMTSAGTINAAGVNSVEIYRLADGGANTLALTNANFSGITGGLIRVYGGNGGNTVDGSAVSLPAVQMVMYGGAGTDTFTGGVGSDTFVFTTANLGVGDGVAGGGGSDELLVTTAGTINVNGLSGVENIALAGSGANTLTLTNSNFTGVTGTSIRVIGGNFGNTVDDSAATGANALVFVGGAGNDVIKAGAVATVAGRAGTNEFEFVQPGTHTITDFGASATNELVFSVSGFALTGFVSASATPQHWTAGNISTAFAANTTGAYASGSPGFNYNTSTGALEYSSTGSSSNQSLVAMLSGHPNITAATQLFFVS